MQARLSFVAVRDRDTSTAPKLKKAEPLWVGRQRSGNGVPHGGTSALVRVVDATRWAHWRGHLTCYVSMPPDSEPCCVPGDIVVSPVYSGFLLGRVIPEVGLGPWWTYITVVSEREVAVEQARAIANSEGVRAWFQTRADEYEPL